MTATEEIIVVAQMQAQAGKIAELRQELQALLAPTRAEERCILYELHERVDTPGAFLFYEIWESQSALEAHLATPHLQRFFALVPELLAGEPELSIWKRAAG